MNLLCKSGTSKSIKACLTTAERIRSNFPLLTILFSLAMAPQFTWASDTEVSFTATIDRIIGLEGVSLSSASKTVRGKITFTKSNRLEPGFYDGHTWQNAVKQLSFGAPINATFSGMGVTLYPDHNFISVFYDPTKCPHVGIVCGASGSSKFAIPEGTEKELQALSYHFHQPDSQTTPPKQAAVIKRFIAHADAKTTKVLVRYHDNDPSEAVLTLVMTIIGIEDES